MDSYVSQDKGLLGDIFKDFSLSKAPEIILFSGFLKIEQKELEGV